MKRRYLRTALFLLFAFIAVTPDCVWAIPAMGQKMELKIFHLLHDNAEKYPLPEGWKIQSYVFNDHDIFVDFSKNDKNTFSLRLAVYQLLSDLPQIGRTTNFIIENESEQKLSEETSMLAEAFVLRIKNNDNSLFFMSDEMKSRESYFVGFFQKHMLSLCLIVLLFLFFVGFALNISLISTYMIPDTSFGKILLFVIVISSAYVRLCMSPANIIHNNGHGIREVRSIVYPESREQKEVMYDVVYNKIVREIIKICKGDYQIIFTINRVLGAITVISAFMLAMAISRSTGGSIIAAATFGFTPAMIWLSSSESPISMYLFFTTAGLAFLIMSAKEKNNLLLTAGIAAIMLASSMRLLTILIIPSAAILLLVCIDQKVLSNAFRNPTGMFLIFFALLWSALHYAALGSENVAFGLSRFSLGAYVSNMKQHNIYQYGGLVSPVIALLAILGFFNLLFKSVKMWFAVILVLVINVPISFTCVADTTDIVRYQSATIWIILILLSFIPEVFSYRRKAHFVMILAIVATIVVTSAQGIAFLNSGDEEIDEMTFIESYIKDNDIKNVVLPASSNKNINIEFPDYINKIRIRRSMSEGGNSEKDIYLGLDCYRYEESRETSINITIRPECSNVVETGNNEREVKKMVTMRGLRGVYRRYYPLFTDHPIIGFYSN